MHMTDETGTAVQVDIISDVMCPWCIVGFKQLEVALARTGLGARVRWHPFELNPDMVPEGENLGAHLRRKYGSTPEQSRDNRQKLSDIGAALGFAFNLSEESKIVNSFRAHALLDFAATQGVQHPLKLVLFRAHFSEARDLSDDDVLISAAAEVGLDAEAARAAMDDPRHGAAVRAQQKIWAQNGISGVPTMIFAEKYMVSGAQGPDAYEELLRNVTHAQAHPH